MKDKRDYSFDVIKGVLIILVIVGHVIHLFTGNGGWSTNPVFLTIYTFHMPLFIFISGFFSVSALRKPICEVVTVRFKRLIIPLLLYSTIIVCIFLCSPSVHDYSLLGGLYKCYRTYWFLINIFLLTIVFRILYDANNIFKLIFVVLYISFVVFYNYLPKYILKDCQVVRMILIFSFGILYRLHTATVNQFMRENKYLVFLIVIIGIVVVRWFYGFDILLYPAYIRIMDGLLCSLLAFVLLKKLFPFISGLPLKLLVWSGQNSLAIYLLHVVLFKYFSYYKIAPDYSVSGILLVSLELYVFSVIYIYIVKKYLKSTYQYILGV